MCYLITDNEKYIQLIDDRACVTTDAMKATTWMSQQKANNFMSTLPIFLQRYAWHVESAKNAVMNYDIDMIDVDRLVQSLSKSTSLLERKLLCLQKQLSIVDLERSDIEHFIEFNDFDEKTALDMCTQLHDNAEIRRKIKNEIAKIECLFQHNINSKNVKQLKDRIDSLQNRQYSARVLSDMFEK